MTLNAMLVAYNLAPCAVALISALADATLMCRLRRMPDSSKAKLFVRQLWQLAISNFFYCVVSSGIMYYQFNLLVNDRSDRSGRSDRSDVDHQRTYCQVTFFLERGTHFVNMAAEVHIALVFLAVTYKALRTLHCLRCSLLLIWVIGLAAAAADVATIKPQWDPEILQCYVWRDQGEGVFLTVFIVTCLACYVLSLLKVCRAEDGQSVQRRVWHRMSCYLLMALFINGPTWWYYVFNVSAGYHSDPDVAWLVTKLLLNFGGLLNFLLYAQQSKHVQRGGSALSNGLKKAEEADLSFNVRFRTDPSFVEGPSVSCSSHGCSAASPAAVPASSEFFQEERKPMAAEPDGPGEETMETYYEGGFNLASETPPSTMARIRSTWQLMARVS